MKSPPTTVHTRPASEAVTAAFPGDPDFPQVAIASDPRRMLEVFRAHLRPAAGRAPVIIEDCVPFRFRCRQGTSRCVLQYTLHLLEPGTERRWDQWVTGLVYAQAGEAERLWRELQTADARREIPSHWLAFEPVEFIRDLEMLVVVFPFDRRLPNLRPVLSGAAQGIEALLLAQLGPGDWCATERTIEPTRYRTELGAALRYTLQAREAISGSSTTRRCYLKVYRNDRGEDTFRLLQALSERPADATRRYGVVRPLGYLPELRTLILEEAAGTTLRDVLLRSSDPTAAVRSVGRAVAAFNQDALAIPRCGPLVDQLEDLRLASTLLQWTHPDARTGVQAITAAVARGLEDVPPAPIHGDLKPDHIFLAGDDVNFIDLDAAVLGDPVRDPAHLFAYITGRVGLEALSLEQARAIAGTFADEYFRHVPRAWRERFRLHCAGALIEVASGIFRRQEPQWRDKVSAVLEEARRAQSGEGEGGD